MSSNDSKKSSLFSGRLRLLLQEKGVSQRQAAKELGFDNVLVNRYIMGKVQPTLPRLVKIADYFGVSLDYLAGRDVPVLSSPEKREIESKIDDLKKLLKNLDR